MHQHRLAIGLFASHEDGNLLGRVEHDVQVASEDHVDVAAHLRGSLRLDALVGGGGVLVVFEPQPGQSRDVTLVPLNSLFGKRYSVYWQVSPS